MEEQILNSVDAEQAATVEPQTEPDKTNIAEVVEPQQGNETQQKAVQSPEENARFAEVRRKAAEEARIKARDEMIAEMYGESHGIRTYAEYQEALAKQEQEQRLTELLEQNVPEEYAKEMLENRKFREQFEAEKNAKQQQEKQQADFRDFISAFPDVKSEDIPTEVWKANESGIPLRYAYAEYALKQTRVAEAKAKANAENAKGSMGSVSGDGVANEPDFISFDVFEKNKDNQSWIIKNLDKINKSRANW